jgi:O-antigen/teichoic acid export membrane protein
MKFFLNSPLLMTWIELFIKFGSGLILLPIATVYLSVEELAFYLFIGTLLGLAYLAEGGFNKVVLRAVSYFNNGLSVLPNSLLDHAQLKNDSTPNYQSFGSLVQTSLYLYVILGGVAGVFLYFIGGMVSEGLIVKQANYEQAKLSLLFISIFSCLYIIQLRYIAFIQGINFLARQKRIEILFGLLRLGLLATAIVAGFGILGITIGLLISVVISLFLYNRMWRKLGPVMEIEPFKKYNKLTLLQLYPAGWRQATMSWGAYLVYSGTTLLVAQFEDVVLIASYLLTLQIVFLLKTVSLAPAHSSYPQISKAIAKKDFDSYRGLLIRALKISLAVYIFGAVTIILLANPVLSFIGSNIIIIDGLLLYFILFVYLLELHHVIHATFYTATNHIPFVLPALISGVLIIGVGYMVMDAYGIIGVVFVQFIVQLAFNNWYPVWLNLRIKKIFS